MSGITEAEIARLESDFCVPTLDGVPVWEWAAYRCGSGFGLEVGDEHVRLFLALPKLITAARSLSASAAEIERLKVRVAELEGGEAACAHQVHEYAQANGRMRAQKAEQSARIDALREGIAAALTLLGPGSNAHHAYQALGATLQLDNKRRDSADSAAGSPVVAKSATTGEAETQ